MKTKMKSIYILSLYTGFLLGCLAGMYLTSFEAIAGLIVGATFLVALAMYVIYRQSRHSTRRFRVGRRKLSAQGSKVQVTHGMRQIRINQQPSARGEAYKKASA
jgi:hypothetical protein